MKRSKRNLVNKQYKRVKLRSLIREYLGLKVHQLQFFFKRLILDAKYRSNNLQSFSPPIPKPSINQNQIPTSKIAEYVSEYLNLHTSVYPFISSIAQLHEKSVTLDFGCGFGTLAAAYKLDDSKCGNYYGYDTNPQAVKFCRDAYSEEDRFAFFGPEIDSTTNYVTNKRIATANDAFSKRKKAYPSSEDIAKLLGSKLFNCQFSLSVFTHMWPEDAIETFRVFREFSAKDATFINSWLILDDVAISNINQGKADRNLPIEVGGIHTYSQLNPLVCTAYPIEKLHNVYSEAGHVITDIRFGSWSGRENGVTYQDIVISKQI
jgi:hypothetical protein